MLAVVPSKDVSRSIGIQPQTSLTLENILMFFSKLTLLMIISSLVSLLFNSTILLLFFANTTSILDDSQHDSTTIASTSNLASNFRLFSKHDSCRWIINSGATDHMCHFLESIINIKQLML